MLFIDQIAEESPDEDDSDSDFSECSDVMEVLSTFPDILDAIIDLLEGADSDIFNALIPANHNRTQDITLGDQCEPLKEVPNQGTDDDFNFREKQMMDENF